mgnify:FL=1
MVLASQFKSNPAASVWSLLLLGLAALISIELFQHGHTIFGSFFLLENLHKLAHSSSANDSDHTAHVVYH